MEKSNIIKIAEVKTQSPFGYSSGLQWHELFNIAERFGDWISIHTDFRWGGSIDLIRLAREKTKKPILAKGIHEDDNEIEEIFKLGADYVLVVGREIDNPKILYEPLKFNDLSAVPKEFKIVWNARDLTTGNMKKEKIEDVKKVWNGWLCQASFIRSWADVASDVNAILIGEGLQSFGKNPP